MANDDNVLKKFLNWNSGWEDWEITDDEPPVPADSDLDKFDSLIERPTPALKTWMEEYIYAYWNEGHCSTGTVCAVCQTENARAFCSNVSGTA